MQLPALALFALAVAPAELDRGRLIDNLGYGVQMEFKVQMILGELDVPSRGAWLAELIARYAGDDGHPVAHLARARTALAEKRTEDFRTEIDAAVRGLAQLLESQGDAFEPDLRFLYGYCFALIFRNGGRAESLERGEQVFLGIFERDPHYWQAAEQLVQLHLSAAWREGDPQIVLQHLEQDLKQVERALEANPDVYSLHELRGQLRQQRLLASGFDPEDEQGRAALIEVWRDWRASADLFEEPAAARACIAVIPASFMMGLQRSRGSDEVLPEDLEALSAELIADIEGAIPYEVFAGRAAALAWVLRFAGGARGEVEAEAFERAVELYAEPELLHSLRILESLRTDDCALATSAADAALKAMDDDNANILAAHVRLECGDREQGEALLRARLAEKPSGTLRRGLGVLLLHLGQDDDGMRELRAVLEEEPDSVMARFGLGTALALGGDLAGGLEQLKRARDLWSKPSQGLLDSIEQVEAALAEALETKR